MYIELNKLTEEICEELHTNPAHLPQNGTPAQRKANAIIIRLLEGLQYTPEECGQILHLTHGQVTTLEGDFRRMSELADFRQLFQICKHRLPHMVKDYANKYETNLLNIPDCIVEVMRLQGLTRQEAKAWYHHNRPRYTINDVNENGYRYVLCTKTGKIHGAGDNKKDLAKLAEGLGYGDLVLSVANWEELIMQKEIDKQSTNE